MLDFKMTGFDELSKRLDKLSRDIASAEDQLNETVVETTVLADERGFIARSCPSCSFDFKVSKIHSTGEVTTCPSCGYNAPDSRWETKEQVEHAKSIALEHTRSLVGAAVRGSSLAAPTPLATMVSGTINVMRDQRWVVVGLPAKATEALRLERECSGCGSKFSFIGSAFFCPWCGLSSAEENFQQTITQIQNAAQACRQLDNFLSADDAANFRRAILEKGMADLVTGFQLIAEKLYNRISGINPPMNAFQRLEGDTCGDALWQSVTGKSYADYIGKPSVDRLRLYFQRRHLLAHHDGFVDQKYIARSGDTSYAVAQRLVISSDHVNDFSEIIERLVTGMKQHA